MQTTELQQNISAVIEEKLRELDLPEQPSFLYDPVRYTLSLGGKRIRPYFTLAGCGLCGGEPQQAIPAALAIELLHNFTLLHDDIMDQADTRRGHPSVHVKWSRSTAILSGDAMYAWAFKQLQQYGHRAEISRRQYTRIMDTFMDSVVQVCEGQAVDLEFEERSSVSVDEYLEMIRGKTAALISAAFRMGGLAAGADDRQTDLLGELGEEIGIAFQIQDDLLDSVADPEKFGKRRGGDIAESKKTYLSILSLERSEGDRREQLRDLLQGDRKTDETIDRVIDIYRKLGILDETRREVDRRYRRATDLLEAFDPSESRDDLHRFLQHLNNREF